LASLQWLGEFQILACIPLSGSVRIRDIAELSGAPPTQLARVVRLVSTCGFLEEREADHVAHTGLSACFVNDPSYLDAAMFLAETAGPIALQAVPGRVKGETMVETAKTSFLKTRDEQPKLRRQWAAYQRHAGGVLSADEVAEVLGQLRWTNINSYAGEGAARCIVETGVTEVRDCVSARLAVLHPTLRFVVQVQAADADGFAGKTAESVTVSRRFRSMPQPITNAAVYILHFDDEYAILGELQAHLGPLRASNGVLLLLTPRFLSERGALANPEAEAAARSRDLMSRQLLNEGDIEMSVLLEKIGLVQDMGGKLVVVKKLFSPCDVTVALVVGYQAHALTANEM
jgi:hypothetical protein